MHQKVIVMLFAAEFMHFTSIQIVSRH